MPTHRVSFDIPIAAGRKELPLPIRGAFVRAAGGCTRDVRLYAGFGTSEQVALVRAYEHRDVELPLPVELLTAEWDAGAVPARVDFLVSDGSMATSGGIAAGVLLAKDQILGEPELWASALGSGDAGKVGLVTLAFPPLYEPWDGVPVQVNTYASTFKRTARDYSTNSAFAAAGTLVLATLWNPTDLWYVRLVSAEVAVFSSTAAAEIWVDLYRINTQPTGGSSITPAEFAESNPAPQAEARRVPSGGAAVTGEPLGSAIWRVGAAGADSTVNPAPPVNWQTVYKPDYAAEQLPYVPANLGLALVMDCNAIATVRWAVRMKWIEEGV